jgi:hypothetical protein
MVVSGWWHRKYRRRYVSFIEAREVVDRETGETHRHHQVVEIYREKGRDQRRILAHLGEHPTVEEAVAGLRERRRDLETMRDEHREAADRYASDIRRRYSSQLKKYHGGCIPERSEHHRLAWPKPWATERGRRYMRDFGRVEWKRSLMREGQTYEAYSGYETFGSWVHLYWWHERKAAQLQARVEKLSAKLNKFEGLSTVEPGHS